MFAGLVSPRKAFYLQFESGLAALFSEEFSGRSIWLGLKVLLFLHVAEDLIMCTLRNAEGVHSMRRVRETEPLVREALPTSWYRR